MPFHLIDVLVVAYVLFGINKGHRRGLAGELPSVISLIVFSVTGCGLYNWTGHALANVNHAAGQTLGVFGFVGLVAGTIGLVRHLRGRVRDWAQRRYGESTLRLGGAIAGGARTFLLASVCLLVLAHWPLHFLTRPLAESSLLGRGLMKFVLPVYEKTHGAL